ncbi:hypothetical protein [Bradyrhizobium sp. SBR1B]|uniref:hypothetical protein n=1 Tax=Bradyrhizobium sp. SBR1B TaxID=2663836 RepID=UPI00182501D5|nr:hypothetical protein [Bradyrhizobium sp. SBR1B]MBB4383323.1 hypothetical protein [Bradyrhizobium sp. SBR1B]
MTPIEESFIRAVTLLGGPKPTEQRAEIVAHLDTIVDYARDDAEERLAHRFKKMTLNHLDSIGRDALAIVEEKMDLALMATEELIIAIVERKRRKIGSGRGPCRNLQPGNTPAGGREQISVRGYDLHQRQARSVIGQTNNLHTCRRRMTGRPSSAGFMVYLFGPDGNIVHSARLICADEETAMQRAKQLAETNRVELWQLTRKIASYPSREN